MLMPSSTSSSEVTGLRRFACRVGLFLLIQCAIAIAVLLPFARQAPDTYIAALQTKYDRLRSAASPRLLLVGSSNLAFSFDSAQIRSELHLEPVNMGLHQGLGLPLLLNQALRNVRQGDVVVLAVEYLHFACDSTSDTIAEAMLTAPRATVDGMDWEVFKKVCDQGLALLGRRVRTLALAAVGRMPFRPEQPYRHDSFNDLGDVVAHLKLSPQQLPQRRIGKPLHFEPMRVGQVIDRLNAFADKCRARGARVFFTYAPYPHTEFARDREAIEALHSRLSKQLHAELISRPQETVYADNWFYDMEYHTLAEGTARRTKLVIDRLHQRLHPVAAPTDHASSQPPTKSAANDQPAWTWSINSLGSGQ
ncbi:MAG TPA: hypothetical protein VNL70_01740 [Tepidisphaeraceae bacterium]|nr:hypothetical protein [Tepidisphaeraceae bacterium]